MKYLTSKQLCEVSGLPDGTLKFLRANGSRVAAIPGRGPGHADPDLWSPKQCLALSIGRGLKKHEFKASDCEMVLDYLWSMPDAEFNRAMSRGKTFLMAVVTKNGANILPRLVSREAITRNEGIPDTGAAAELGVVPAAIDLSGVWRVIVEFAEQNGVEANKVSQRKEKRTGSPVTTERAAADKEAMV